MSYTKINCVYMSYKKILRVYMSFNIKRHIYTSVISWCTLTTSLSHAQTNTQLTLITRKCTQITWCERFLLITKSPATSCHYRYLKFGSSATSLMWDWMVFSFAIILVAVYTAIADFFDPYFQRFWSRSCVQLAIFFLLEGHCGSSLWIIIKSFLNLLVLLKWICG